jgi:hypothetical protein
MQTHDVNSNDMLESPCKILLVIAEKKKKKTLPIINMEKEKEKDRQCPFAFGLFEDGFSSLLCYISEKTIFCNR